MKTSHLFCFLSCSIAVLIVANPAISADLSYDANTTINSAVSASPSGNANVGVTTSNVVVTIGTGGSMSIPSGALNIGAGATNASLVVDTGGSFTMATGGGKNVNFGVGSALTVQNGGTFSINTGSGGTIYIGPSTGTGTQVTVTGAGSSFTNGIDTGSNKGANIWFNGVGNSLTVSAGATFTSSYYSIYLGGRNIWSGKNNNTMLVTGAGSVVTLGGGMSVDSSDNTTGNSLTISNSGAVHSVGGTISANAGGNNHTATVTGSGSLWDLKGGSLQLGNNATADSNALKVSNGGSLSNVGSVLMNGTNNEFDLGSGALDLTSTATVGTITLGSTGATLKINNGQLTAGSAGLLVSGAGTIALVGSAIISNTDITSGNTISSLVNGIGSLTKLGAGTLILSQSNAYTGDTIVNQGMLSLTYGGGEWLADMANVHINNAGSVLNLNTGTVVDTINSLYLDGVQQAAGLWGAVGGSAPNQSSYITGTGQLNVTVGVVPEPSTLALLGVGLVGLFGYRWRLRRTPAAS